MDTRRALPIAVVLPLLASCSGSSAPHHPRPTPPASASPSASPEAPSFPSSIAIMNADSSGKHRVPHTSDGCEYPSWSPDWTRVVFNCNSSGEHLMYIVDVDGSRVVDLSGVGEGWQVDWSPDGRSIVFASSRDHEPGWTDIYMMRPDGSRVTRLTHDLGYTPAWSPDGRYIVFSAGGLFVMRSDGSGITSLPVDGVGKTGFPDWV